MLGLKLLIPRPHKHPGWHTPVAIPNERVFAILTILHFLLMQIAPHTAWKQRLLEILARYPNIPLAPMGFPPTWEESPIWKA